MRVIVTIPAYNEEGTIGQVIKEIKQVMNKTGYDYKIIVVDDGSTDKTATIAKNEGAMVYSHPINLGLAETFKTEVKKSLDAGADIIVHTDADGQYLASEIPSLISKINEGYDLVLGSRFKNKIEHMPIVNRIGNKIFAKIFSKLINEKLSDTTTGFRAFNRNLAENIKLINTFTYTQEQIIRAVKQGFKICEIPIHTRKTRKSRLFKNPLDYAIKAWINIFRIYRDYNPLRFFGRVGLTLLCFGFLIGIYFTYLHITSGIHGHLGLFFLMLILIFSGLQIILFGFLADMHKK